MEIIYTHEDLIRIITKEVTPILGENIFIFFGNDGEKITCYVANDADRITEIKSKVLDKGKEQNANVQDNVKIPPEHQHSQEFDNYSDKQTNVQNSNRSNRPMPVSLSKM